MTRQFSMLIDNLGQTFEAVLQCLESLMGTVTPGKFRASGAFQYVIDRWSAHPEALRQVCYFPNSSLIKSPDFLAV